jgi:hypothetical protein
MSAARHSKPTWKDVKLRMQELDRGALMELIQDLYAAHKDTQVFLHARFSLGDDVLRPYKETIDRWLWPDVFKQQDTSIAKAKKAVSDYKKAVGQPAGVAELTVYFCERGVGFANDVGLQDEGYFAALVRMFEQAVLTTGALPQAQRVHLVARLDTVAKQAANLGYGVGDQMDEILAGHGVVR